MEEPNVTTRVRHALCLQTAGQVKYAAAIEACELAEAHLANARAAVTDTRQAKEELEELYAAAVFDLRNPQPTTRIAYRVASGAVLRGGWVKHVHASDFVPAYEQFLSELSSTMPASFATREDAFTAVEFALADRDTLSQLFGIPSSANELVDDKAFTTVLQELAEHMLEALVLHDVLTVGLRV